MAIKVSQAFQRTSANPIDESLALTKAQMKTVNDNLMPSKYFTVGQDDGYIYLYDKSNTADPTTGKFRRFEGGSGGASNLADLEDVLLTSLANGQTLIWDSENSKWVNANFPTVPTKTSDLTNDSGFITKAVNDLVNYYLKSETYSKTEVDNIANAIKNSRFEVVATLPTTNIKTNVIYLVPSSDPQTGNVKDEYINLDGTSAGWECIGSTSVDLSGYVTDEELNTALADYVTSTDLTALLADKQDKMQYATLPTPSAELVGKIVEYTGATSNGLTHGYFYECVSDGEATPTYSWQQTNVQPSSGGGASAMSDLTDVDLDDLQDGQVIKWDATNEKWVNGNESGGGSSSTVISQTLTTGSTTVTFTNIPTTEYVLVNFYTSTGINYTAIDTTTAGQVTLTFEAQESNVTVYCEIEYVDGAITPTGAIITPVNSVQIWMNCANVFGLNYITLEEVLRNQPLIKILMQSTNAVDYMIRSTAFAYDVCNNEFAVEMIAGNSYCLNAVLQDGTWREYALESPYIGDIFDTKVPIMASNTEPAQGQPDIGEVICNNYYSKSWMPYFAFDNNENTGWLTQDYFAGGYVGFKFDYDVAVYKAVVKMRTNNRSTPITFQLQSSQDGENWVTQGSFVPSGTTFVDYTVVFENPSANQYYRLYSAENISQGTNGGWVTGELQFYGMADNA